jgi:hypothetical protein
MRPLALSLAVLCLSSFVPADIAPLEPTKSLVALSAVIKGEHRTFCTGVVVRLVPTTQLVSEAHCIDAMANEVIYADKIPVKEVLRDHEFVLLTPESRGPEWKPLPIAPSNPILGDEVTSYGWAFGEFICRVRGTFSGNLADEYFFDLNTIKGMSGGPILDRQGRLVCLIRGVQSDGTPDEPSTPNGLTFCGKPDYLRELISLGLDIK